MFRLRNGMLGNVEEAIRNDGDISVSETHVLISGTIHVPANDYHEARMKAKDFIERTFNDVFDFSRYYPSAGIDTDINVVLDVTEAERSRVKIFDVYYTISVNKRR